MYIFNPLQSQFLHVSSVKVIKAELAWSPTRDNSNRPTVVRTMSFGSCFVSISVFMPLIRIGYTRMRAEIVALALDFDIMLPLIAFWNLVALGTLSLGVSGSSRFPSRLHCMQASRVRVLRSAP